MAKYQIKGTAKRTCLEEVIPLQTPFRVLLEASRACNLHCFFCVHGKNNSRIGGGNMPLELAQKCIDDLKKFPQKIKLLTFSTTGEPLLNSKLPEIIEYAKKAQIADCIDITTNASLMTRKKADKLIKAGIGLINISIYGLDTEQYLKTSEVVMDFDKLLENIRYLYEIRDKCKITIKISDASFTDENDKLRFFDIFQDICDTISVEHVVPMWYGINFSGTAAETLDIYFNKAVKKSVCPVSFFTMAVNANGIVSPCCVDWRHELAFGNANSQSLFDIWNGTTYREFYIKQLTDGRQSNKPCCDCGYPDFVAMDNIDAFQNEILEKLRN
jgi:radical SAM protein with 4Fe4S-binding SPASM domain